MIADPITDSSPSGQVRQASAQAGGHVDSLAAVARALAAAAALAWPFAVFVAIKVDNDPNSVGANLAMAAAATLTVCSAVYAVGGRIRRYAHDLVDHDVAVVCRRLDRIAAAPCPHCSAVGVVAGPRDISDEARMYIAGRLDRHYDQPE